ncbi:hypothetical protein E4U22_001961, partial [Claviceps purpurea]
MQALYEDFKADWFALLGSITPEQYGSERLRSPLYNAVRRYVYPFALQMMEKQRTYLAANHLQDSAEERVAACTGLLTKSMGLPCKHTISQRLADNLILELRDIDPHWYFDRQINPEDLIVNHPMPILEPLATVTRRGRPQGSTATISASQAPTDGNDTPRGRGRPRGRPRGSRGKLAEHSSDRVADEVDAIRRVFREFLITRGVNIAVRRGLKIPVAFARAVEEDNGAEDRLAQRRSAEIEAVELMKMEEVKRAILRRSEALSPRQTQQLSPVVAPRPPSFPRFLVHTQQARPAPGTDIQPPLAHRHLRQLPPKVTESQIPSTSEKKSLHVLRVPPASIALFRRSLSLSLKGSSYPLSFFMRRPCRHPEQKFGRPSFTKTRPGILT